MGNKYAFTQTSLDQARLAIAIERCRIARGAIPETLAELVPDFIAELPRDVYTGQPMIYRRKETAGLSSTPSGRTDTMTAVHSTRKTPKQSSPIGSGSTRGIDPKERRLSQAPTHPLRAAAILLSDGEDAAGPSCGEGVAATRSYAEIQCSTFTARPIVTKQKTASSVNSAPRMAATKRRSRSAGGRAVPACWRWSA